MNSSYPVRSYFKVGETLLRWDDFPPCKQFFPSCPIYAGLLFSLPSVCFYSYHVKKYNSS